MRVDVRQMALQNRILGALPAPELERLLPLLRPVELPLGEVVYEQGQPVKSVYFVATGMMSLLMTAQRVSRVEVGMIGPEGVAGAGSALIDSTSYTRATVQMAGTALRMTSVVLREQFRSNPILQDRVLHHVHAVSNQVVQCGVCSYFHTIEERLCRWLLMVRDRSGSDLLPLTHASIADMLGSRRSAVTNTAGQLRKAGLIEYSRGNITILDREGLEKGACACYETIRTCENS